MAIEIRDISKTYGGRPVLEHVSLTLEEGGIYCLMGASGIGKTTLLRILMGLEQPDGAVKPVACGKVISAVFQENRLLGFADAVKNIRAAAGRSGLLFTPEQALEGLLEQEAWHRPVGQLSGGMQRRAAIARALAVKSELILMDEPFTGLDEETRKRTVEAVLAHRAGRTLLVVTHQEMDAALLKAEVIRLTGTGG